MQAGLGRLPCVKGFDNKKREVDSFPYQKYQAPVTRTYKARIRLVTP